jgi:hypothetical protein
VAQAIATALREQATVTTRRVGEVRPEELKGLDLLIVGSLTRGFRPTPAIKQLVDGIPAQGLNGVKVAAFDTRISVEDVNSWFLTRMVNLFGYAAQPIADRLQKKGGDLVLPPEGFIVKGKEGPLKEGELARAAGWARQISAAITSAQEVAGERRPAALCQRQL